MNYPLISEYVEAIKAAEDNFDQLKHLRPVCGDDGEPVMTSGNFAVVFKMKDGQTGKLHAVKCFLKEQKGRAEAYRQIAEELEYVSSTFLTPIKYLDKELFVDSANSEDSEFPVLLMDWVEGQTLDKYIREHIDDQYELSLLAYQFSRLAMWLMPQPFAHGDLKPDNILVKEDGTLVLVDYDGMYVPAMKGQRARELGSPDFRHPGRTEDVFDDHIDDFSLASILLSLKAIALQPSLLEEYGASDRLLFSEKDYRNLSESKVMDALISQNQDLELNKILFIFLLSSLQINIFRESIYLERPLKMPIFNSRVTNIYGRVIECFGKQYVQIFDKDIVCDITNIEEKAICGLRIIEFSLRNILRSSVVCSDTRYGLVNDKNELVSFYEYVSLLRLDDGNISAIYPDFNKYNKEGRFLINPKGEPLLEYIEKAKNGTKSTKYLPLANIDAVSSCYYGIALFIYKSKRGVVDYQGNILIEPNYDNIILSRDYNYLTTVVCDKKYCEGSDDRNPDLDRSQTYLLKKGRHWPLLLYKLDDSYYVDSFFKYNGIDLYYLKNKRNFMRCICLFNGYNIVISPEYKDIMLLDYWYLRNKSDNSDALFIAVNSRGKYGIISFPTEPIDANPETGDEIYEDTHTICALEYDYIAGNKHDFIDNVILIKDGKEGLFSCCQRQILVNCVIPTAGQYKYVIIPSTYGEGLIGCREEVQTETSLLVDKYYFSDLDGNKVLELPLGWKIISGFENGVAQIQTGKIIIKTADIDKLGNIKIIKRERVNIDDDSYDDIESMYRDAFEDDPNMEWNID